MSAQETCPPAKRSLPTPNPPRGERGEDAGWERVNLRMPLWMVEGLEDEGKRRRRNREPNRDMSSLIREAVAGLLAAAPPWDPDAPARTGEKSEPGPSSEPRAARRKPPATRGPRS